MRTKFNLLATLFMVVLCVGFTSCSDDEKDEIQDDKTLALLVGSWERTETWEYTYSKYDPLTGKTETVTETETYNIVFTFNSDKTYSRYRSGEYEETETGTYNYYQDTKKLTLGDETGSYAVTILEISDKKLIIDDDGDVEEYTRKK